MNRLDGKVAIVTGAARGIGRAVAARFASEGASVVIADVSGDGAEDAASSIRSDGRGAIGVAADVSVRSEVEALVAAAEKAFGTPSVLVCAAGITTNGGETTLLELTDEEWGRVFDVNLGGTFLCSQVAARRMVAAGIGGSIITFSSIGAQRPMYGVPAYHTSKAAISGLTRALAVNLAHHGIRANALAPGYILTDMMRSVVLGDEERHRALVQPGARGEARPTGRRRRRGRVPRQRRVDLHHRAHHACGRRSLRAGVDAGAGARGASDRGGGSPMIGEGTQEHTDARGGGTRIQSVARACQLLLWLADRRHGAAAKEIAFAHRLTLPTTYHLLNTLVDQGLLAKDEERRFVLGRSSAIVAEAYLQTSSVPESLLSAIRELAAETQEVVSLADWYDHEIRILASAEGAHVLRVAEMMNAPYEDAHARANGKLLLAYALARAARVVHAPPSATAAHARHDLRHARIRRRARADPPAGLRL